MSKYDSAWKEVIENLFEDFLQFFFPDIFADIDFSNGYEFLNKELSSIVKDNKIGRRFADELVKVFLKDGSEKWLLIHIEVQGYKENNFEERIFVEEGKEFRKEWRHLDSKRKEYQSEGQDRIELYTQMQEMYEQLNLPHTIYIREGPGSPGSLYNLDITSNGENPLVVDPLNFSNFSRCRSHKFHSCIIL